MSAPHYLVFVGASASLSDEIRSLRHTIKGGRIIAPAVTSSARGLTKIAINRALTELVRALKLEVPMNEYARLSVWTYESMTVGAFDELWQLFGRSAWIELVPRSLWDKNVPTRTYLERRVKQIAPMVHEISSNVFNKRRSSPLPLPLTNFRSHITERYRSRHWYLGFSLEDLKADIRSVGNSFRQHHTKRENVHCDDRQLLFKAAANEACHGQAHPVGDADFCFVNGRFRFGTALFPGHHYDVRPQTGRLTCTLYDCDGQPRDMNPEKRQYINMFPNDHLLPKMKTGR